MPHAGQQLEGPNGFLLRLVRTGVQTGGEVLEMEATYSGAGGTVHQMTGEGRARLHWEVRPALRTAEFFERLYAALAGEGIDGEDLLARVQRRVPARPRH